MRNIPVGDSRPAEDSLEVDHSSAAEDNHPAGRSHCYHCRNNRWQTCWFCRQVIGTR